MLISLRLETRRHRCEAVRSRHTGMPGSYLGEWWRADSVRSAEAELKCRSELFSSLQPSRRSRCYCQSGKCKGKKKQYRSCLRWRSIRYSHILLLPHLGGCNRTRSIVVGIVCCQLGSHSKCHQESAEQQTQQIEQGGLTAGMVCAVHCCQDTASWALWVVVPIFLDDKVAK